MTQEKIHKHASLLPFLNRIAGQVTGIGKMIESDRYCPDILNQIRAVRSALHSLEGRILRTHLNSCVRDAFLSQDKNAHQEKIEEIVSLFLRYEDRQSPPNKEYS